MIALGRWAGAVLLAGVVVVVRVPCAEAAARAPSVVVAPVSRAPSQIPTSTEPSVNDGLPCLPVVGCDPLGGLGADAAQAVASAVFRQFGTFVADGVGAVLNEVVRAINATTQVTLDAQWFREHFEVMRTLAVLILLPLMLVGLIGAIVRRDGSQLVRAGLVYAPVAILGGFATIELTDRALQLTDWATAFVTGDLPTSAQSAMASLADAIGKLSASGAGGLSNFLVIVVLLLLMAGALLIWIELLLRTGAIYVVVLFLPLAMSGLVWRGTVAWTRRMVEVLVALLLSKFAIVVVIDLAAGMITAGDGVGTVMQGATLLLLAAFAPFALLRLVPIVEAGAIGQLERLERRPVAAVQRATTAVVGAMMGGVEASAAGSSVAANGGGAQGALAQNRELGGQLNNVRVPKGWTAQPSPLADEDDSNPGPPAHSASGSAAALLAVPTSSGTEASGGGE